MNEMTNGFSYSIWPGAGFSTLVLIAIVLFLVCFIGLLISLYKKQKKKKKWIIAILVGLSLFILTEYVFRDLYSIYFSHS